MACIMGSYRSHYKQDFMEDLATRLAKMQCLVLAALIAKATGDNQL